MGDDDIVRALFKTDPQIKKEAISNNSGTWIIGVFLGIICVIACAIAIAILVPLIKLLWLFIVWEWNWLPF
jgi:type IV secretory pathway component VirB8